MPPVFLRPLAGGPKALNPFCGGCRGGSLGFVRPSRRRGLLVVQLSSRAGAPPWRRHAAHYCYPAQAAHLLKRPEATSYDAAAAIAMSGPPASGRESSRCGTRPGLAGGVSLKHLCWRAHAKPTVHNAWATVMYPRFLSRLPPCVRRSKSSRIRRLLRMALCAAWMNAHLSVRRPMRPTCRFSGTSSGSSSPLSWERGAKRL